jgi:hypothetical protein
MTPMSLTGRGVYWLERLRKRDVLFSRVFAKTYVIGTTHPASGKPGPDMVMTEYQWLAAAPIKGETNLYRVERFRHQRCIMPGDTADIDKLDSGDIRQDNQLFFPRETVVELLGHPFEAEMLSNGYLLSPQQPFRKFLAVPLGAPVPAPSVSDVERQVHADSVRRMREQLRNPAPAPPASPDKPS